MYLYKNNDLTRILKIINTDVILLKGNVYHE